MRRFTVRRTDTGEVRTCLAPGFREAAMIAETSWGTPGRSENVIEVPEDEVHDVVVTETRKFFPVGEFEDYVVAAVRNEIGEGRTFLRTFEDLTYLAAEFREVPEEFRSPSEKREAEKRRVAG